MFSASSLQTLAHVNSQRRQWARASIMQEGNKFTAPQGKLAFYRNILASKREALFTTQWGLRQFGVRN